MTKALEGFKDVDLSMRDLMEAFLEGTRSRETRRAYDRDLRRLAEYLDVETPARAMDLLVKAGPGKTNRALLFWKAHMQGDLDLAPATINRRLSAVRSAFELGQQLGLVDWTPSVRNEKVKPLKDTSGPGEEKYREMLKATDSSRDRAILHLLHDLGLRRGEIVSLDRSDLDTERGVLNVVGKGDSEPETLTLPPCTAAALAQWLQDRPEGDGPLFCALDNAHAGHRLSGRSIARIVKALGREVGVETSPHGIRHTAITRAVDKAGLEGGMAFARHANPRTTRIYLDNLEDRRGETAALVARADDNANQG
jgi:integrase/recombinase XerC